MDTFFAAVLAQLRHQGSEAYDEPLADRITMPPAALFTGYDHYYATLAHELAHWTGHDSRLGRDLRQRFGTRAYAAEELVGELASAMLGADLGLPVAHLDHHASYLGHWLELLGADERAILTAAARAEEAAAWILGAGGRARGREETGAAGSLPRVEGTRGPVGGGTAGKEPPVDRCSSRGGSGTGGVRGIAVWPAGGGPAAPAVRERKGGRGPW